MWGGGLRKNIYTITSMQFVVAAHVSLHCRLPYASNMWCEGSKGTCTQSEFTPAAHASLHCLPHYRSKMWGEGSHGTCSQSHQYSFLLHMKCSNHEQQNLTPNHFLFLHYIRLKICSNRIFYLKGMASSALGKNKHTANAKYLCCNLFRCNVRTYTFCL